MGRGLKALIAITCIAVLAVIGERYWTRWQAYQAAQEARETAEYLAKVGAWVKCKEARARLDTVESAYRGGPQIDEARQDVEAHCPAALPD